MKFITYGLFLALTTSMLLSGCTSVNNPTDEPTDAADATNGHGAVVGSTEVSEAPLHLISVDKLGATDMIDLLNNEEGGLGDLGKNSGLSTEGRYLFTETPSGLEITDSGMWSWNHTDHFHYYRGQARTVGTLPNTGEAVVSSGPVSNAGNTGVYFPETGQGVLLDNAALAHGELKILFTTERAAHRGVLAPLGDGAVVSEPMKEPESTRIQYLNSKGEKETGAHADCDEPTSAVTTQAGLVVGCAQGILIASQNDKESVHFTMISYPNGTKRSDRIGELEQRKSRPVLAGTAGEHGAWLFNARTQKLERILEDHKLLRVSAVGDSTNHVIAMDAQGRVLVYSGETGKTVGNTEVLLPETLRDAEALDGVSLALDAQRAYLNAPKEMKIYEIDFADNARISRTLEPHTAPYQMVMVGQ